MIAEGGFVHVVFALIKRTAIEAPTFHLKNPALQDSYRFLIRIANLFRNYLFIFILYQQTQCSGSIFAEDL